MQAKIAADALSPFVPDMVIYIEKGGRPLGDALATHFGVRAIGIDIAYPLSRLSHPLLTLLVFPFKEVVYRLTRPRVIDMNHIEGPLQLCRRLLLVDDTASSGKTLRLALGALELLNYKDEIRVVVGRAGANARALTDVRLNEKTLF